MLYLVSILKIIFVLLALLVSGYLYSSALFPVESRKGHIGCALIIGSWLYVATLNFIPDLSPVQGLMINFLFCGVVGSILQRFFVFERQSLFVLKRIEKGDFLIITAILLFYFFVVWRFIGYDEIFNFTFASQVRNGKIPPSAFGFPETVAKYHYGWGILLGAFSYMTSLPLPVASDILTLFSVGGCVLLVLSIFENIGISKQVRLWGTLIFFSGGGLFVLPNLMLYRTWRNGMGTTTMFQSHPWTFGFGIFLIILTCLSMFNKKNPCPDIRPYIILGIIPVLCLPFINATSISFILLVLAIMAGYFILKAYISARKSVKYSLWCIAGIIFFMGGWFHMGGVFSASGSVSSGEFPIGFSPLTLGGQLYVKYMLSYILLGLPGFVGFFISLYFLYQKKSKILDENPAVFVCIGLCLLLYPLPFAVWLKPFPAWDNFCKFPYFGVLAGLFLFVFWVDRYVAAKRSMRFKAVVIMLATLVFCHESVILMARFQFNDAHAAYYNEIEKRKNLISIIKSQVSLNDRIIVINKECKGFYQSEKVSGQKTNLYQFLGTYFSEFLIVAKETGAAIVNFELLTLAYPGTAKGDLLSLLQLVHEAPVVPIEKLSSAEIRYILCAIENIPEFVKSYQRENLISLVQSDEEEEWILWKVN